MDFARIPGSNGVWYIPNFVTSDEEEYLIRKINETAHQKWKELSNRRLQIWGGEITQKGILFAQPLPPFLKIYPNIMARLKATGAFESSPHGGPNHIILNEYLPGQGIMPHEDGPIYHPVVATISLGSHSVLHYYQYAEESGLTGNNTSLGKGRVTSSIPVMSLFLERRSLVITTDEMYASHLHGIEDTDRDEFTPGSLVHLPDGSVRKLANRDFLTDEDVLEVLRHGGLLRRTVRYSLTCRDVRCVAGKAYN
ncbi:hypothetical protein APHAL10511_007617 [Amanita phalloides]|nr:hypothetical protein APHAL10511_007617 [Amanita phalloides]